MKQFYTPVTENMELRLHRLLKFFNYHFVLHSFKNLAIKQTFNPRSKKPSATVAINERPKNHPCWGEVLAPQNFIEKCDVLFGKNYRAKNYSYSIYFINCKNNMPLLIYR